MVEGGEAHDSIELELAAFIAYGAAAWIRPHREIYSQSRTKWTKPMQNYVEGHLTILLANMAGS